MPETDFFKNYERLDMLHRKVQGALHDLDVEPSRKLLEDRLSAAVLVSQGLRAGIRLTNEAEDYCLANFPNYGSVAINETMDPRKSALDLVGDTNRLFNYLVSMSGQRFLSLVGEVPETFGVINRPVYSIDNSNQRSLVVLLSNTQSYNTRNNRWEASKDESYVISPEIIKGIYEVCPILNADAFRELDIDDGEIFKTIPKRTFGNSTPKQTKLYVGDSIVYINLADIRKEKLKRIIEQEVPLPDL